MSFSILASNIISMSCVILCCILMFIVIVKYLIPNIHSKDDCYSISEVKEILNDIFQTEECK